MSDCSELETEVILFNDQIDEMIKLKTENRKLTLAIAMLRKGITEPDYSPYEKEIEKLKLLIIELEKRP